MTKRIRDFSEVRADKAGRIGLGTEARERIFQVHLQPNGTIVLFPSDVMAEREEWFRRLPERTCAMDRSMGQAKRGEITQLTLDELLDL